MSMHIIALYFVSFALCIYAWKDWFKGLCGLILMTAVASHPSFPTSIAGIQGLNMWNLVFANVGLSWLSNRRREGLSWDMPRKINVFLVLWLCVLFVAWMRMIFDRSQLAGTTLKGLVSDDLINVMKWPMVGLLLFDGCRTRHRFRVTIASIVLLFVMFSAQIIRVAPSGWVIRSVDAELRDEMTDRVGISPNGAGKMMSGVPWAMLAVIPLAKKRQYKFFLVGACVTSIYAVAVTGSRAGYLGCCATTVFLSFLRWRRSLLLLPLAVLIIPILLPGAVNRMTQGFGETDVSGEKVTDRIEVTSGRNKMWPVVAQKIFESPVYGFGMRAMLRIGLTRSLANEYGEYSGIAVSHPHNAYLEVLLESGLIGFVVVVGLYGYIFVYSIRLFVDRADPLHTAAGGLALALLTGHLVANMGGQSFYPRVIDVGLWCAIGIMLRFYVERSRLVAELNDISCQHMQYQRHYSLANAVGGF